MLCIAPLPFGVNLPSRNPNTNMNWGFQHWEFDKSHLCLENRGTWFRVAIQLLHSNCTSSSSLLENFHFVVGRLLPRQLFCESSCHLPYANRPSHILLVFTSKREREAISNQRTLCMSNFGRSEYRCKY